MKEATAKGTLPIDPQDSGVVKSNKLTNHTVHQTEPYDSVMNRQENIAVKSTEKAVSSLSLTPGAKLKKVREQRGLTEAQVASRLYLPVRYIKAIESNQYNTLPGIVYVRGYLRAYCKLLNISSDALIGQLDLTFKQNAVTEPQKPTTHGGMGWTWHMGAIAAVVIVLFTLWLWPKQVIEAPITDQNLSLEADSESIITSDATELTTEISKISQAAGSTETSSIDSTTLVFDQLQLQFSNFTWIQIKDAKGFILLDQNQAPGSSQSLQGRGPFTLLTDQPDLITIQLNGQLIPLTRAQGKQSTTDERVLQFTISNL